MVLHDILCICTCISDLKCVRARVHVCTRGAFGQGGVCLKSVCQLCACTEATWGGVCRILEIYSAYFCYIEKAIPPPTHSNKILNAALCIYERVCACVFEYVCTVVYPSRMCVRVNVFVYAMHV